jgi:hypothetical protein
MRTTNLKAVKVIMRKPQIRWLIVRSYSAGCGQAAEGDEV